MDWIRTPITLLSVVLLVSSTVTGSVLAAPVDTGSPDRVAERAASASDLASVERPGDPNGTVDPLAATPGVETSVFDGVNLDVSAGKPIFGSLCFQPQDHPEYYGPTDVSAQLGNQGLSVATNDEGTITVFRWPRPSFYDQIKYHTSEYGLKRGGADVNAGAFLGLVVSNGTHRVGSAGSLPEKNAADRTVVTRVENGSLGAGENATFGVELAPDADRVVLELSGGSGDLDLYATLDGRSPTETEFDRRSWGQGSEERIRTTAADELGVLVDAFERGGSYTLRVRQVDTDPREVSFEAAGGKPVVVGIPESAGETNDARLRVGDLTRGSFDVRGTSEATAGYAALEPGTHLLADGTRVVVGRTQVGSDPTTVAFEEGFGARPTVLADVQTADATSARVVNVTPESVTLATNGSRSTVGYVAVLGDGKRLLPTGTVRAKNLTTTWLRSWNASQHYPDPLSDTLVTTYRSESLGLVVNVTDVLSANRDVLTRDVEVHRRNGSPVEDARLVAFENFNLVASKHPLIPVKSWCTESNNHDAARYEPGADAVVHYKSATDDVAVAMGFEGASDGHQVGGDAVESGTVVEVTVPIAGGIGVGWGTPDDADAYRDAADGLLAGNDRHAGDTTGALVHDLSFENGTASAAVHFAAAESRERVTSVLSKARERSESARRTQKRRWFHRVIGDAPLPDTADEDVLATSRRALVTLVQNYDPRSGAIVASIATQSPYGQDWIRDGAYFNYVLDRLLDRPGWVRKHNLWYASIQEGANRHVNSVLIPDGNWAMDYYADGTAGGPIPWEIDETGYGIWTLYDHYRVTGNETYLRKVYPAIRRAANFLTECRDDSGLQCPAHEDDRLRKTQTIVGGASVYAGMSAAVKAARALNRTEDARRWAERRDQLAAAIDREYWGENGYGASPRVAMPAFLKPYDSPRMRAHMEAVWEDIRPTFEGKRDVGLYEAKALFALAKGWEGTGKIDRVKRGLKWIAKKHATPETHIMGEAWMRREDGTVRTTLAQPHAWEQLLFYLAALETYPPSESVDRTIATGERKWENIDAAVRSVEASRDGRATVAVENVGDRHRTFVVTATVGNATGERATTAVTLAPNASANVTLNVSVSGRPDGEYDLRATVWASETPEYPHTPLDRATVSDAVTVDRDGSGDVRPVARAIAP